MSTPAELVRERALLNAALVAVIGTRFYAATSLPAGYHPIPATGKAAITGPAIHLSGGSGSPGPTSVLADLSFEVRAYAASELAAQTLDALLYAALHDTKRGIVRAIRCTQRGEHVPDPDDAGWHYYRSSWQVTAVIAR